VSNNPSTTLYVSLWRKGIENFVQNILEF